MQLARLRRWHWMLIGLVVGLLIGFLRSVMLSNLGDDGEGKLTQHYFERALKRQLAQTKDECALRDVKVYRLQNGKYAARLYYKADDGEAVRRRKVTVAQVEWRPKWYCPEFADDEDKREFDNAVKALDKAKSPSNYAGAGWLQKLCERFGIKPKDPPGGLLDYLRRVKDFKDRPLQFTYVWWAQPRVMIFLWTVGCFLGIGVVWPTVVNLIAFGSLFRPLEEKKEKRPKLPKSKPAQVGVKAAAGPTQKDMDELARLEAELEAKLKAGGPIVTPLPRDEKQDQPVRQLTGAESVKAVEPEHQEDKHFDRRTGDFYPVERHATKKDSDKESEHKSQ